MPKLRELWTSLQEAGVSDKSSGMALRLLHTEKDVRLFAAVTNPGNCAALVIELPVEHRPKDLTRISTRTFEAVAADFAGLSAGKCGISVTLKQPEYLDLFVLLGDEIVIAIQRSASTADACRAVVRCIDRWRRFVEKNRLSLTDEEIRGLIGELVVLCRAIHAHGNFAAVNSWQGPTGSLRDFELPDFTVEVKTYQAESGAAVRINDPQQLEGSIDRPAYLAVVRISQAQTHGRSLPEFIAFVESRLAADLPALDLFRDRLAALGYLAVQNEQYETKYSASAPQLFAVRDGFPRILPAQVPGHVQHVHFSIVLTGLTPFSVDAAGLLGSASELETE